MNNNSEYLLQLLYDLPLLLGRIFSRPAFRKTLPSKYETTE